MSGGHMLEARRKVEQYPDATPEQWAAFAEIVREKAPDLADMLLGEAS